MKCCLDPEITWTLGELEFEVSEEGPDALRGTCTIEPHVLEKVGAEGKEGGEEEEEEDGEEEVEEEGKKGNLGLPGRR